MFSAGTYAGCNAYIRDDLGEKVAKTTVVDHNKHYMTITVRGNLPEKGFSGFVHVLILESDGVHEYRGKIQRSTIDALSTEIALFKGKVTENRSARRYDVNTSAVIENTVVDKKLVPLPKSVTVFIVNLSSSGALLLASPDCFEQDSLVELEIDIAGQITVIYGQIVWIKAVSTDVSHYGCKFLAAADRPAANRLGD